MDFSSNDLILAVIVLVVIVLVRTLFKASKEINSSDKFPTSGSSQEDKKDDESSL